MALKKSFQTLDTFSMSSMTDVIFLLLIFFMVTSTLIFPAAIDVNLPPKQRADLAEASDGGIYRQRLEALPRGRPQRLHGGNSTPGPVTRDELLASLMLIQRQDSLRAVALYADSTVAYARVIEVLDLAARNNLRLVLATRSSQK